MNIGKISLAIVKYIFLSIFLVISIVPLIWVFLSSFKTNPEILAAPLSIPEQFKLTNYKDAFEIAPMATFYVNSIFVSIIGTFSNLVIIGMASYAISRFDFKGKRALIALLSVSLLLPVTALLQPLFMTINKIGLYDSLWGLILVYAGFGIPVSLYILRSYFLTIPEELEEAAYLDGAGIIRTFVRIIIPISKPAFATAGVLQFLLCWNEFQFALVLTTGNDSRTLPLALSYFTSLFSANYGAMFAATMLIIIPTIIVYIFTQEQVISGLVAGSVKG